MVSVNAGAYTRRLSPLDFSPRTHAARATRAARVIIAIVSASRLTVRLNVVRIAGMFVVLAMPSK